ncbi:hypothetical protein B0O80DRAFT_520759 [Mortierella sp. GBAus27b]|nr:hypothetical protein B0O80DRAFT_520759 [Mortierella sp. GBAus27b]
MPLSSSQYDNTSSSHYNFKSCPFKMTSNISILDVPHVMERIGLHLDRKDRESCSLVNRAFHKEFQRLVWRELVFLRLSTFSETKIEPDRKTAMLRNTQWTRKVTIDTECRTGVLSLMAESCSLLRDFKIFLSESEQQPDPDEALLSSVIDLLERNTQLKTCSLVDYSGLSSIALGRLAEGFSRSQCLAELALAFCVSPPPSSRLKCILQSLPKSLRSLSLQYRGLEEDNEVESFPKQDWPESYPNLEAVKLIIKLSQRDEVTLSQFLQRCPALTKCSVPRLATMQGLSNFINSLEARQFPFALGVLDCRQWNEMNQDQWNRLLLAMQGNIRSFATSVDFSVISNRGFIRQMTRYWSQTLEAVNIYNAHLISSQDIQLILTTCQKLKKFDCLVLWQHLVDSPQHGESDRPPLPGLDLVSCNEGGTNDGGIVDWGCLDLEELKLTFSSGQGGSTEASQQRDKILEEIYRQLGRLTRLKELTIGWYPTSGLSSGSQLDMTLENGLVHMRGLKSLRTIDLGYIPQINIGEEEARWMLTNWPALQKIDGLIYRHRMLPETAKETAFIRVMCSERPWLVIA